MRQFPREMPVSTIPPGRVRDRGAGLGWDVLEDRVGNIVFEGDATALEKGAMLGETVDCANRLARKACVR